MDINRNPWQCRQAGSAGSYLTDTGGDEETLQQSRTTPHYSVPYSDWQTLGEEPWQEEQLSWFNTDLEDHLLNAEFRSQFQEELNGNSHAPSEPWDGGVATAPDGTPGPDPEILGMCNRATPGPLPKTNDSAAAAIAQRNQKKIYAVKKTGRRPRAPNWTVEENRSFLQNMEVQKGKSPWKAISDSLKAMGIVRDAKACEYHWGVLLADLKKFQNHFGSDNILRDLHLWPSVGTMNREQRSQNGLPLVFEVEWFEAIARIKERSKHRKFGREYSKGRIDVAGTPSCSCRQQPQVSAASAAPSSEIFDNPVWNGDGISELVKLLGSTDGNVTFDQIIEFRKISLEEQKMDLRRQEMELERERMYSQRNGLTKKARRPPAALE